MICNVTENVRKKNEEDHSVFVAMGDLAKQVTSED